VIVFIFFAQKHQKENEKQIAELLALQGTVSESKVAEPVPSSSMAAFHQMSFASRECMACMASAAVITGNIDQDDGEIIYEEEEEEDGK